MTPGDGATAKPFPFAALPQLTRADIATARRLRSVASELVDVVGIEAALSELIGGERVRIALRRHRKLDAARGPDDAIGVVLAPSDERVPVRRVIVEVDGALGAALAARALRQRAPRIVDAGRAPSPAIAGAVAAVLVAALRRAHSRVSLRVLAAGPGAELSRNMLEAERDVTTSVLSVVMGDESFEARIHVSERLVPSPPPAALSAEALEAMGAVSIALPLVIATVVAARADLLALAPGDAIVLGRTRLQAGEGGAVAGPVALVAPRSERGLSADLAADGRLVVGGLLESHPWESVRPMPSEPSATTTLEVLEDAPVVVRVELGTVEMKAREWAALGPGDVVTLGRRLGDPAILRVGGAEVARGELVMVEGEYAVRILGGAK